MGKRLHLQFVHIACGLGLLLLHGAQQKAFALPTPPVRQSPADSEESKKPCVTLHDTIPDAFAVRVRPVSLEESGVAGDQPTLRPNFGGQENRLEPISVVAAVLGGLFPLRPAASRAGVLPSCESRSPHAAPFPPSIVATGPPLK
ncbi:MAG: hypothetical protein HZB38_10435 [Planctomycetes bacterium]|nr:hypothetical protein [Planctomycetota bacterium]